MVQDTPIFNLPKSALFIYLLNKNAFIFIIFKSYFYINILLKLRIHL